MKNGTWSKLFLWQTLLELVDLVWFGLVEGKNGIPKPSGTKILRHMLKHFILGPSSMAWFSTDKNGTQLSTPSPIFLLILNRIWLMLPNRLSLMSPSRALMFLAFIHLPNSSLKNANMAGSTQKFLGSSPGNNQEQSIGKFPNSSCNQIVKPWNLGGRTDLYVCQLHPI